ncbi:aspartyl-phosphate phosphatase Spo0E family protein [Halobacillus sp. KCTC 3957]|uniref:Aspartyl-phosphate phosphatase Spo0E family protein n=2 Tax=Halobacillus yeomjeoni TaxID=311194 RepID=A0A931HXT4_9BACI|nr:aspartyl-phosphate phosphatase Spo0E family protein [Halobacillus yeomjeoni]
MLELQIESVRSQMYEAYKQENAYEQALKLSQKLDELLNEFEGLTKQMCV